MSSQHILCSLLVLPMLLAGCSTDDPDSTASKPAEVETSSATPTAEPSSGASSLSCEEMAEYRQSQGSRDSAVAVPAESITLPQYVTLRLEPQCVFTSTDATSGAELVTFLFASDDLLESWDAVDTKGSPDYYYNWGEALDPNTLSWTGTNNSAWTNERRPLLEFEYVVGVEPASW